MRSGYKVARDEEGVALGRDEEGENGELGHASFTLARGRLDLHPELLVGGGTVTAHAVATWRHPDLRSADGKIERVDLARLGADTAMSPLWAGSPSKGRGTAPSRAVASLRLDLDGLLATDSRIEELSGQARLGSRSGRAFAQMDHSRRRTRRLERTPVPSLRTKTFFSGVASLRAGRPRQASRGPLAGRSPACHREWPSAGQQCSVKGGSRLNRRRLGRLEVTSGLA